MRTGGGIVPALLAASLALFGTSAPSLAAAAPPAVEAQVGQLDALRHQAIAAAEALQQREHTLGALELVVRVMQRGVDSKEKEIAESREQQETLLGALERLAKAPPEALAFAPEGPVDRVRSGVLIAAAVPALSDQARELSGQLAALGTVRRQIESSRKNIDDARATLDKGRDALAALLAKRNALTSQLLRDDGNPGDGTALGNAASDPFDLIKRADAASDQRDKDLAVRLHVLSGTPAKGARPLVDPTKPKTLRGLDAPHAEMLWPVSGDLIHRFGEADNHGRPSQGLTLTAMPKGVVVAPFDGRVDYVGTFRGYGLVLIIRHGAGYHSLLAGLGHADVTMGQWLLAGEPVGSLLGADNGNASASLYLELRRNGRPVDPQSRLRGRDQKTEDIRVRE